MHSEKSALKKAAAKAVVTAEECLDLAQVQQELADKQSANATKLVEVGQELIENAVEIYGEAEEITTRGSPPAPPAKLPSLKRGVG